MGADPELRQNATDGPPLCSDKYTRQGSSWLSESLGESSIEAWETEKLVLDAII